MAARASGGRAKAFFKMSVTSAVMSTSYAETQAARPKRPKLRAFWNPTLRKSAKGGLAANLSACLMLSSAMKAQISARSADARGRTTMRGIHLRPGDAKKNQTFLRKGEVFLLDIPFYRTRQLNITSRPFYWR